MLKNNKGVNEAKMKVKIINIPILINQLKKIRWMLDENLPKGKQQLTFLFKNLEDKKGKCFKIIDKEKFEFIEEY